MVLLQLEFCFREDPSLSRAAEKEVREIWNSDDIQNKMW